MIYPSVVIFNEKFDKRVFVVYHENDYNQAMRKVAVERATEGYWYDEVTNKRILEDAKSPEMFFSKFMKSRSSYEYESYDILTIEKV